MTKNKLALFLTGLCCFALDTLLQTPMMSTIGFSLVLFSGIWFIGSRAKGTAPGSTLSSKVKEEWGVRKGFGKGAVGKVKDWGKRRKKGEEDIRKKKKDEKWLAKNQKKHAKKDDKLYKKLIDAIKEKNPEKINEMGKKLHISLEEETQLYIKERDYVVAEQRIDVEEEAMTMEEIKREEALKKSPLFDKDIKKDIKKEEKVDIKEDKLQREVYELDDKQKKQLGKLGRINQDVESMLRSIEILAQEGKFSECLNVAKNIGKKLKERNSILEEKKGTIEDVLNLTKKVKRLLKKGRKIQEDIEEEAAEDTKEEAQLELDFK